MPQFLIEPSAIKDNTATITGKDARHISQVLRLKKGDWMMLTDGQGHRWKATIIKLSPKEVVAELALPNSVGEPLRGLPDLGRGWNPSPTNLTLAQAVIKHDRLEWIIQKAVELGCSRITPFTSERTIPKFWSSALQGAPASHPKGCYSKLLRWQKIALEAAKQCGTTLRPIVEEPVPFTRFLRGLKPAENNILFYEGETSANLNTQTLKHLNTLLIIGPEGGFSLDEVRKAKEAGVVTCGLGPLILRVETASIAALTLVQNRLGYFDKPPMSR